MSNCLVMKIPFFQTGGQSWKITQVQIRRHQFYLTIGLGTIGNGNADTRFTRFKIDPNAQSR